MVTIKLLDKIQKELELRGKTAQVMVITLDPENDTSDVLLRFKKRLGPGHENWHFLRADLESTKGFTRKVGFGSFWKMSDHPEDGDHLLHSFKITFFNSETQEVHSLDWDHREIESLFEKTP